MKGFSDLLRQIYVIQRRYELTDREILATLDSVCERYRGKIKRKEDRERSEIKKMIYEAALRREMGNIAGGTVEKSQRNCPGRGLDRKTGIEDHESYSRNYWGVE